MARTLTPRQHDILDGIAAELPEARVVGWRQQPLGGGGAPVVRLPDGEHVVVARSGRVDARIAHHAA
jgi:hypothetical protein